LAPQPEEEKLVLGALPNFGIKIMTDAGVNVVLNSDNPDEFRYLNLIVAKVLKYNDIPEEEVLRMITINPASIPGIEKEMGSLEEGKTPNAVIWSGSLI
jgi:imidazolonepropionase-like amidohydrolase